MRTCARPGCNAPATTRQWCESDYRRQIRMGRAGYRDATPVRQHVRALRRRGWTYEQIADAAGVSTWVPHKLDAEATRWVWADRGAAILAVPLVPRGSHRGVDGTGTYRRLAALQWLGWPPAMVAERVGLRTYTLTTMRSRGEPVSYRVALAMARLYAEWSTRPGPSRQTATKARRRGYAPPSAWCDIDDPREVPLMPEVA
jgi:hypothetical protein